MIFPARTSYSPLSGDDHARPHEEPVAGGHGSTLSAAAFTGIVWRTCQQYASWLNVGLFCTSILLLCLRATPAAPPAERNWLLKQLSRPSPVLNDVDVAIRTQRFDVTLLLREPLSIFRREPSREVDRAWEQLGDLRLVPLSRDDVVRMGKDPDDAVQFPASFGLGPDAYAGRLDVFHQIHCLDALRREAYFEHYYGDKYPGGFNDTTEMHRLHLSHCIHYLLQHIVCHASADVYTHIWTDAEERPFPDFGVSHQCRDFRAIKRWQDEHAVAVEPFVALTAPPGAKVHRMSRKFKELHGYFETHVDDGTGGDEVA